MTSSSKRVIYVALIGNVLIAITKAAAAVWTGSAAMVSEAVHSFVDTGNQILLLYGMQRAARNADPEHPIDDGRELYFWSFIVALMIFALGAGVSIYEGVLHLQHIERIRDPMINYGVLGIAFIVEGASWLISLREVNLTKGTGDYYTAFRKTKDPTIFMVLLEDSAALLGILIAALGIFAATSLKVPMADGIASICIGMVLACTASLLARESKSLLIGERADRALCDSILRIAEAASAASRANGVLTVHLAPEQILAALSLEFADDLRAPQIEDAVINIERKIKAAHPEVVRLFVKPQTAVTFKATVARQIGAPLAE